MPLIGDYPKPLDEPTTFDKLSSVENTFLGALNLAESTGASGKALKLYNDIIQRGRRNPITKRDFDSEEQEALRKLTIKKGTPTGRIDYPDYLGSGVDNNLLGGFSYNITDEGIDIEDTYDFNVDRADGSEDNVFVQVLGAVANPRGLAASIGRKLLPDTGVGVPVRIRLPLRKRD